MRDRLPRWLAGALAGAAPLWPYAVLGQGAPIPLLPPTVTTPATPQRQPPAAPYQLEPPAPYQAAPTSPNVGVAPTPYQEAPAEQYQAAPQAPYQESPAAPSPEQTAPVVATPLAPPTPTTPPSPNATPGASAPSASTSALATPSESTPSGSTAGGPAPNTPAPTAQAPAQEAQPPTSEQSAAPPRYPNVWVPEATARLLVLNKIDSLRKDLTVKVGQSATYGPLSITVQSCLVRPPNQPADATAFLIINDSDKDQPGFRGWTLANEPWLSMLQSPTYDVWVTGCQP